jgi:hypothetical protein
MPGTNAELYERDYFEWTQTTARLVRSGCWQQLDRESVAEELESLGNRDKREVISRLEVLLMHLLKWRMHPQDWSRSWRSSIRTQRRELARVLEESPSLRARLPEFIAKAYPSAVEEAVEEMRLYKNPFPPECPYTPEQIMDTEFLPDAH